MIASPVIIDEANVSVAWAKAFLKVVARGVPELSPLVVTVRLRENSIPERKDIRTALDSHIQAMKSSQTRGLEKLQHIDTVANTIFPLPFWNRDLENHAQMLYERFEKAWPRIRKCSQNRRGSYFRRLTSFRPLSDSCAPINQLQHIVDTYRAGNHRRSALQATIFDPALDHVNSRQLGFPCLHQVSFAPINETQLAVTGYYAMQYIVDRAYGNYLGLCRLGEFIAKQLGMTLARMTCVAAIARLGTPGKSQVAELITAVERTLLSGEEPR